MIKNVIVNRKKPNKKEVLIRCICVRFKVKLWKKFNKFKLILYMKNKGKVIRVNL